LSTSVLLLKIINLNQFIVMKNEKKINAALQFYFNAEQQYTNSNIKVNIFFIKKTASM